MGLIWFCTDQEWRTYCLSSSAIRCPRSRSTSVTAIDAEGNRARVAVSREEAGMTEVAEVPVAANRGETKRISHWIGGKLVEGTSGRSGPVYNPATGAQTGEVDFATAEEVDNAVQAAKAAFPSWRALSLSRRTELFFRIRKLVDEHRT